jgi:hypothetical protein
VTGVEVLDSTALLPWQFKLWKDSIVVEAKSSNLWDLFTGEKKSKFDRRRPLFGWELQTEVWVRDPSDDVYSMGAALSAEIDTGATRTLFAYAEDDSKGDIEATPSPPLLPRPQGCSASTADHYERPAEERTGRRRQVRRDSPEVEDHELADIMRTTDSETFYYSRFDAFRRAQGTYDADERLHLTVVEKGMALLKKSLSAQVKKAFASVISTGDVHAIWETLCQHCGPRSDEEGLHALEKYWAAIHIQPDETMSELMLRIEETASSFEAYPSKWGKSDDHKRLLVRSALSAHADWDTYYFEIRDSARCREDWMSLRFRLEAAYALRAEATAGQITGSVRGMKIGGSQGGGAKALVADSEGMTGSRAQRAAAEKALAATPAVQSLLDKARSAERKKAAGGGDSEDTSSSSGKEGKHDKYAGATLSSLTCFLCLTRGHVLKDCPLSKEFRRYRTDHKARLAKETKSTAAAAKEGDEDSDGEETVGVAVVVPDHESFDDWLGDPDESALPAVEVCASCDEKKKPHIVDSGCSSSVTSDPDAPLTEFQSGVEYISLGNSSFKVKSEGRGTLGILKDVMLAPDMSYSMTSVSALDRGGMGTFFGAGRCLVVNAATRARIEKLIRAQQPGAIVMSATMKRKLYHVDAEVASVGTETEDESASSLGAAAAADSAAPSATGECGRADHVSGGVRVGAGGGSSPEGGRLDSVQRVLFSDNPAVGGDKPSADSYKAVSSVSSSSFSADSTKAVSSADSTKAVTSAGLSKASSADSKSVVPYTFKANRQEIMGSFGSERIGTTAGLNPLQRLHLRAAHAPKPVLIAGLRVNAFKGALTTLKACEKEEIGACDSCIRGTMRQETVTTSSRDLSLLKPMEEIGFDPVKLSTVAFGGESYVNFGLCYGSKLAMAYGERTEGNQVKTLKAVKRDWCLPYGHSIRVLHTDFGSVFQSHVVNDYLLEEGIKHDCSAPHQHAHNLVEAAGIRVLLNRARVLLSDSGLNARFALFAIQAAVFTWNKMLHPVTSSKTPWEKVTGAQPDISVMRPFGAPVYYFNTKEERNESADPRWKERASKGILLGYSPLVEGGYLVYPGGNKAILHRKQVIVVEAKITEVLPAYSDRFLITDPMLVSDLPVTEDSAPEPVAATPKKQEKVPGAAPVDTPVDHRHEHVTRRAAGIGHRAAAVALVCAQSDAHYDAGAELQGERAAVATALPRNPRSIGEALGGELAAEWQIAITKERDACLATMSFVEVDYVPERYLRSLIAFRVSRLADGTLKFKARLCPDGSGQVQGKDYDQSYSPTVRKETILLVTHVAAARGWLTKHIDIGNAYKEVPTQNKRPLYMKLTKAMLQQGFAHTPFVKLLVNYWGTKQAGREWHAWLGCVLMHYGFERSGDDPCLFYIEDTAQGLILLFLLFVDDLGFFGNWEAKLVQVLDYMKEFFDEVKIEDLSKFVGMQLQHVPAKREIHVTLQDYANEIVDEHVPAHIEGSLTTLFPTVDYRALPPGEEKPIWDIVGKLRFLADSSWHELKVAASLLASAGATPHKAHRRGVMKALQYVKQVKDSHTLVLGGVEEIVMFAMADASYSPEGDSKFLFGHCFFLSPAAGAFSASSKRSTTVAHSSAESEVKAITECCKQVGANREMLELLGAPQLGPTKLYTDSQAAVDLISCVFQARPKCRHFNRDINYVRECQQEGLVELVFTPTDWNAADVLTKILAADKHARFTSMLLVGVGIATVVLLAREGMSL